MKANSSQRPEASSQLPTANGQIVSQTPLGILFVILLQKVIL
jgi:hypothetical protein